MGLDITAYRKVFIAEVPVDADGLPEDWQNYTRAFVNRVFRNQADAIINNAIYGWESAESFRIGSYTYFNTWRHRLAILSGWTSDKACWRFAETGAGSAPDKQPFIDLINFSDCEGIIGAKTSAKLLADFNKFRDAASRSSINMSIYDDFASAFKIASDSGFVSFH